MSLKSRKIEGEAGLSDLATRIREDHAKISSGRQRQKFASWYIAGGKNVTGLGVSEKRLERRRQEEVWTRPSRAATRYKGGLRRGRLMVARHLLVLVLCLSFCAPPSICGNARHGGDGGISPWSGRTRRGGGRRGSAASAATSSLPPKSIPHIVPPNPLVDVHTGVWAGDDADADGMVLENQAPSTPVWAGRRDEGYSGGTPVLEQGGDGGVAMAMSDPSSWDEEGRAGREGGGSEEEGGEEMLLDTPFRGHGGGQCVWPRRGADEERNKEEDEDDKDKDEYEERAEEEEEEDHDDDDEEEEEEEEGGTADAEWTGEGGGLDGSNVGYSGWQPSRVEAVGQRMGDAGQQEPKKKQQQSGGVPMPDGIGRETLSSPRGLPIAPDDYLYPAPKVEYLGFTPAKGRKKHRYAASANPLGGGIAQDGTGVYGGEDEMGGDDDGDDDDDDDDPSEGTTADELCDQGDARLRDETIPEAVAWESSCEAYMRAWHLDPSHPGALTRLAYMAERSKQQEYGVARGLYDLALQTDPGNLDALVLSGHNYQRIERDVQAASEQYRRAVSLHPTSASAAVSLASLLLEEYKDSAQAGQLFARASRLDPLCADAWHGQAASLLHVGNHGGGAEALLRRALRFDPSHTPSLFELARVRWRAHGDAEQAMTLARRALNLDPSSCYGMCQYGYMQAVSGGDLLGAEETYRRAILLGPDRALPHCELAQLLIIGGGGMAVERKQEIQMLFDKALDLEPKNPKTLYQLAMFIGQEVEDGEDSADYSKPEDLLYRAYQESPDDPYVLVAYGQLLVGPGLDREESHTRKAVDKRRAGEFFDKAAAVAPHRWEFHLSHAGFLEIHGRDYDSALEAYQRAAQCNPAADEVHFRLGKLLQYHLRDFEGAEKAYQACLGVAPAHGEALAHYGLLLCNSLRHYSSARKVLERALALVPDHEDAKLGLKFLTLLERAVGRGSQQAPDRKRAKIRRRVMKHL